MYGAIIKTDFFFDLEADGYEFGPFNNFWTLVLHSDESKITELETKYGSENYISNVRAYIKTINEDEIYELELDGFVFLENDPNKYWKIVTHDDKSKINDLWIKYQKNFCLDIYA